MKINNSKDALEFIHTLDTIAIKQMKAENARLKAEVERLTKAGDAIYQSFDQFGQVDATTLKGWQAAKGVKP